MFKKKLTKVLYRFRKSVRYSMGIDVNQRNEIENLIGLKRVEDSLYFKLIESVWKKYKFRFIFIFYININFRRLKIIK